MIGDLLRLLDMMAVGALGLLVYALYVYPIDGHLRVEYLVSILIAVFLAGLVFHWSGVYSSGFLLTRMLRAERVIAACAVTFAILLALAFALKISSFYSRVWTASWFSGSIVVLVFIRVLLSHWIGRVLPDGGFANRTVIVGCGEQARRLMAHLRLQNDPQVRVLGLIDDQYSGLNDDLVLGDMEHLIDMIRDGLVDQVLIAIPWNEEGRLHGLVHKLAVTPAQICLAPDLAGYRFLDRGFARVARLPVLELLSRPISGWSYVYKTIEDRTAAALCLCVLGLPMLLIALLIRLDSPGPALFKQQRRGFNDTTFEVWKYRTMYQDANDPSGEVQASRDDARVTRIGRLLRRTSLDELPQLINVLRGDMSIVGPRPHALSTRVKGHLFEELVDRYAARHRVKPGITGWAQVNGWRGETDTVDKIQKRVECDLYYIDNWSIWLDLLIILRTFVVFFKDEKAY